MGLADPFPCNHGEAGLAEQGRTLPCPSQPMLQVRLSRESAKEVRDICHNKVAKSITVEVDCRLLQLTVVFYYPEYSINQNFHPAGWSDAWGGGELTPGCCHPPPCVFAAPRVAATRPLTHTHFVGGFKKVENPCLK